MLPSSACGPACCASCCTSCPHLISPLAPAPCPPGPGPAKCSQAPSWHPWGSVECPRCCMAVHGSMWHSYTHNTLSHRERPGWHVSIVFIGPARSCSPAHSTRQAPACACVHVCGTAMHARWAGLHVHRSPRCTAGSPCLPCGFSRPDIQSHSYRSMCCNTLLHLRLHLRVHLQSFRSPASRQLPCMP